MTSPDGIIWTACTPTFSYTWYSVSFGNGIFVAASLSGSPRVMTSSDGISWSDYSVTEGLFFITSGNGVFVGINANSGTKARVYTSPGGATWTVSATLAPNNWNSIAFGNYIFVAEQNWHTSYDIPRWYYLDLPNCCTGECLDVGHLRQRALRRCLWPYRQRKQPSYDITRRHYLD